MSWRPSPQAQCLSASVPHAFAPRSRNSRIVVAADPHAENALQPIAMLEFVVELILDGNSAGEDHSGRTKSYERNKQAKKLYEWAARNLQHWTLPTFDAISNDAASNDHSGYIYIKVPSDDNKFQYLTTFEEFTEAFHTA